MIAGMSWGWWAGFHAVVAVVLGYFLGGEALGLRTVVGTLCVLVSVVLITVTQAKKDAPEGKAKLA